jgi:hypothetical protein
MEPHVHVQEMSKRLSCDFTDRTLGYRGKEGVSEFRGEGGENSSGTVCERVDVLIGWWEYLTMRQGELVGRTA